MNESNNYDLWETDIIERISYLLDVTTSDAQGIVEAQPFIMAQSWGKGLGFEETAELIIAKAQ